jgi:Clostripain family
MRQIANYLVASEDLVPNCGWAYEEPLKVLTKAKGLMEPKEFATSFVRAYGGRFRKGPSYATLSAVNLGKIEELAPKISALAKTLSEVEVSELANIEKARNGCRVFGRDDGFKNPIDIEQFLYRLERFEKRDTTLLLSVSSVLEILNSKELILARFAPTANAFGLTIISLPTSGHTR